MVCAAVVLLQLEGLQIGKIFLEVQYIVNGSSAESINTLGIIADNEHITRTFIVFEQLAKDSVLQVIGILKLIHVQVSEFVPVALDHVIRVLLKQPEKLVEEVVKVHSSGAIAASHISFINFHDIWPFGAPVLLQHLGMLPVQRWRNQVTLANRDSGSDGGRIIYRRVEVHFLDD